MSFLGPNPRPTFLYFPTVLPRPAEVSQKKTESDEARRLLERDLGEAGGQLRRLLPGGSLGEAPTHKSAQIFDKAAQGGARAGAKFSAAIDKLRRRRLLLGEDLGKLAKGGGGFSWRRCRRCSETLPRPSPGDNARRWSDEALTTTPGEIWQEKLPNLHANTRTGKSRGGDPRP